MILSSQNCCASHKVYCSNDSIDGDSENAIIRRPRRGRHGSSKTTPRTTTTTSTLAPPSVKQVKLYAQPSVNRQVESTYRKWEHLVLKVFEKQLAKSKCSKNSFRTNLSTKHYTNTLPSNLLLLTEMLLFIFSQIEAFDKDDFSKYPLLQRSQNFLHCLNVFV